MFKQKLMNFMRGRNGVDELGVFLNIASIVLLIAGMIATFFSVVLNVILTSLAFVLLVYWVFRAFSRNISKRAEENRKYVKLANSFKMFFRLQKNKFKYRKTHRYRKCPKCKNSLRLPYVKGEHSVKCPKCNNSFRVKL